MLSQDQFDRLKRLSSAAATLRVDENFVEIIRDLKNRVIRSWSECTSPSLREELWHDLQAVGKLENYLDELGQSYRIEAQRHKING